VDNGGVVVQLGFSFFSSNTNKGINGRWVTGGYSPYTYASTFANNVVNTLGNNDNTNPLMQGVTTLQSNFHNIVTLSVGATQVAAWNNGDSLIAYKPIPGGHITFGITAYLGKLATWTGDFARVIANARRWAHCPLQLSSAVSRKSHGATPFNIGLPLTGLAGVECRTGGAGNNHTLVFTFTNNVVSGNASVTTGIGSVLGTPTFNGNTMTVNLTGVADVQTITVTLSSVTDSFSQVLANTAVSVNMLIGDVSANKSVTNTDVVSVKGQAGASVTAANFRVDITVNGVISNTDVSATTGRVGSSLP
jgi:hypothetical protein